MVYGRSVAVRRHGYQNVRERNAFGSPEQRYENERGEYHDLRDDRNQQGAAAHAAVARELNGVAVYQAGLQRRRL
jgi:hypothetical protein